MLAPLPIIFSVAAIIGRLRADPARPGALHSLRAREPEVMAVIAFLWPTPPWAEDFEKGIADMPDVREKYVAAGLSITGGAV